MLSGSLIPIRIARLAGSFTSKVVASAGGGGFVLAAVLNALYNVEPSGANTLPPTFCWVLIAPVKGNGALALFCCAMTKSVAVPYRAIPAMKRDPSGDMDSTDEAPATVRLRRT